MEKKYQPQLIGVAHWPGFEGAVIKAILRLKPHSVGIEAPASIMKEPTMAFALTPFGIMILRREGNDYWFRIRDMLQAHGIKVVPLVSDALHNRIERIGEEQLNRRVDDEYKTGKMNLEAAIIMDTLTRDIRRHANATKPDVVVTGLMHSTILRKDMGIPKEKYQEFMRPEMRIRFHAWLHRWKFPLQKKIERNQMKKQLLNGIVSVRRLRRARSKQKEAFHQRRTSPHS